MRRLHMKTGTCNLENSVKSNRNTRTSAFDWFHFFFLIIGGKEKFNAVLPDRNSFSSYWGWDSPQQLCGRVCELMVEECVGWQSALPVVGLVSSADPLASSLGRPSAVDRKIKDLCCGDSWCNSFRISTISLLKCSAGALRQRFPLQSVFHQLSGSTNDSLNGDYRVSMHGWWNTIIAN